MTRSSAVLAAPLLVTLACQGEKGDPGVAGQSVTTTALAPGSASCPYGGTQLVSAGGTTYACNGAPGADGQPGEPPAVLDGTGAVLGTLVGTSPSWSLVGTSPTQTVIPTGQMLTYLDPDGLLWNVGIGSGNVLPPRVTLYFASADCTGDPLVQNVSPQVPVAFSGSAGPLGGIYLATDVAAGADPQSFWASSNAACTESPPAPPPPPFTATYRNVQRLGDFPPTPKTPPLSIQFPPAGG